MPLLKEGAAKNAEMIAKILGENPANAATTRAPARSPPTSTAMSAANRWSSARAAADTSSAAAAIPSARTPAKSRPSLLEEMGLNTDGKDKKDEAPIVSIEPLDEHEDAA